MEKLKFEFSLSVSTQFDFYQHQGGTHIFFLACALSGYIFVNPFTSCVTDRYQYKHCIMMETETETNMKICIY